MDKYIKYLYRKPIYFILVVFYLFAVEISAENNIRFTGEYFIFSDQDNYIYGSGNITMKRNNTNITGKYLYLDIDKSEGVLLGNIIINKNKTELRTDAFFFKIHPFKYYTEKYEDTLHISSILKKDEKIKIKKINLKDLKSGALYYEFNEFIIGKKRKIKAKNVIPYIMGFPSLPFKRFTIKRGDIPEKTMLYPESINYSGIYGLTLNTLLRIRSKVFRGDNKIKLFEKGIFGLGEPSRGFILSGKNNFYLKKKKLFELSLIANSDVSSFNIIFEHKRTGKNFTYEISQTISGRKDTDIVYNFKSGIIYKGLKFIRPNLVFTHNLKNNYSYDITSPFNLFKRLSINLGIKKNVFKDNFISNTLDFSSSAIFSGNFFKISSNFNSTKNFIETSLKKNFSLNLNFDTVYFLQKNIGLTFSTFYMFSKFPSGENISEKISPGINIMFDSKGFALPLGFSLNPVFVINQIWDNQSENYTDFNPFISLRKKLGSFLFSIDYSAISHYESDGFWVEGYNTTNIKFNIDLKNKNYDLNLKFLTGNDMKLESILFNGKIYFSKSIIFSSFLIYYYNEKKMQTTEIFIEKNFRNVFKIQGGYSLALKKFFIKVLTL
jgi:hypothetical protein